MTGLQGLRLWLLCSREPGCGFEEAGPHEEGVCQRAQVMGLGCQV